VNTAGPQKQSTLLCILILGLLASITTVDVNAEDIKIGDTREQVLAILGQPQGRIKDRNEETLAFPRAEVVLKQGRVTEVHLISDEDLQQQIARQQQAAAAGRAETPRPSEAPKKDTARLKEYDSALEQAKADRKLVLVDFYTDWCGWCKKLDRDTYSNQNVQIRLAKDFILVKVNPEKSAEGKKLAQQFGVHGYPFVAVVDADGNKISQIAGYKPAFEFLQLLEQATNSHNKQ